MKLEEIKANKEKEGLAKRVGRIFELGRVRGLAERYAGGMIKTVRDSVKNASGWVEGLYEGILRGNLKEMFHGKILRWFRGLSKWAVVGIAVFVVAVTVGTVGALNGWFGGGSQIPSDTLTRGLVGYWNFDEGSGELIHDQSGNAKNATTTLSALTFDASDDNITVNRVAALEQQSFTLEAWVKPNDSGNRIIFAKDDTACTGTCYSYHVRLFEGGKVIFLWNDGSSYQALYSVGGEIAPGNWYHLVFTFTSGSQKMYINGVLVGSSSRADTITYYTTNLLIGIGQYLTTASYRFNGLMDGIRIYSRVITAAEVIEHYRGVFNNSSNLVMHLPFNDGSGATVADASGSNNNGSLSGTPVWATTDSGQNANNWTVGKKGSAMEFRGISSVSAGNVYDGVKTAEFWVKPATTTASIFGLNNTQYIQVSSSTLSATGWTSPTIYVNGVKNASTIVADVWSHVVIAADTGINATNTDIGRWTTNYFAGTLDEVRLYSRTLSDAEVRYHYNSGGPVVEWKFDEGSGSTAYDSTDSKNDIDLDFGWNLSTAAYNNASSTFTADNDIQSIAFKSDGTKMYVASASPGSVYQLSLSSPWEISKASYDNASTSVNGQLTTPRAIAFSANGTKMYVVGTPVPNTIYQYTLSTPWDISTASYDSVSLDVSGQDGSMQEMALSSDGTKMYLLGDNTDDVFQYTLSTPWSISGASLATSYSFSQDVFAYGIALRSDGQKMYMLGQSNDDIFQYSLSSAWAVNTASYDSVNFDISGQSGNAQGFAASSDGTRMYVSDCSSGCIIFQYSLTAGQAASYDSGKYGTALSLNGTTNFVKSEDNISAASNASYSLWFESIDGVYSADEYLFDQYGSDPAVYLESTDNKIKVAADGADKLSSSKTVNDDKWHNVQVVADGSNIKLYLDGKFESQAAYTGSSARGLIYIGSNITAANYFGGRIDDFRIYNYARSASEIKLDYNAGFGVRFGPNSTCDDDPGSCMTEGLVGYWNMDEGSGSLLQDISGSGRTAAVGCSAVGSSCSSDTTCCSSTCGTDADSDSYFSSSLGHTGTCHDVSHPYTDCDDSAGTKYQNITCYLDSDGDNYTVADGTTVCKGASCAAPADSYKALSSPVDCYDSNANAKPGQTTYYTTNRGDGSYDYDCSGGNDKQAATCNGTACSLGGYYVNPHGGGYCPQGPDAGYTTCSNPAYEAGCGAAWTTYGACYIWEYAYQLQKGPSCYQVASYYTCPSAGSYTCACR